MKCPFCGAQDSKVMDSRATENGNVIRRRRECITCRKRFRTYEKALDMPLVVIKKDGRREAFDRRKVQMGILRACEKRPVSLEAIETMVTRLESELLGGDFAEVSSVVVGEKVLEQLLHIDEVAYVRFASVYKAFNDVKQFAEEMESLSNRKPKSRQRKAQRKRR